MSDRDMKSLGCHHSICTCLYVVLTKAVLTLSVNLDVKDFPWCGIQVDPELILYHCQFLTLCNHGEMHYVRSVQDFVQATS